MAALQEDDISDIPPHTGFPVAHWRKLRCNNSPEQMDKGTAGGQTWWSSILGALIIGSSTGAVMSLAVNPDNIKEGANSMTSEEIQDLKEQVQNHPEFGFVTKSGRTGKIDAVDSDNQQIVVDTPKGESFTADVGDGTIIKRVIKGEEETLTFADLTSGTLVTVTGPINDERGNATIVEVVPVGEDGFTITPSDGTGPSQMPVLP